ncbi:MAG: hypothetical protein ACRD1W_06680 [Vicinamibacterales bacterium]
MRGEIERFSSGWSQVNLRIKPDEVDALVKKLQRLTTTSHFHLRGTYDEAAGAGVADIEISLQGPDESDNLVLE